MMPFRPHIQVKKRTIRQSLSPPSGTTGIILTVDFHQVPPSLLSDGGAASPARLRVHDLIPLFCLGSRGVKCGAGRDGDGEAAGGRMSAEEEPRWLDPGVPEGRAEEEEEVERGDGEM